MIGHGSSSVLKSKDKIDATPKHIERILETEGYDKAHLVGVSVGSLIAQYFALKYPKKVSSLTSLGGYNINQDDKEVKKIQNSSNFGLVLRALFSMKSFRKKTAKLSCHSPNGRALFYQSMSNYKRKSFLTMQGLQNVIKERNNVNADYPTLILVGEFDLEIARKMAKEWNSENSVSVFYEIKNAGHCANLDQPLQFNMLLEKFIHKTSKELTEKEE